MCGATIQQVMVGMMRMNMSSTGRKRRSWATRVWWRHVLFIALCFVVVQIFTMKPYETQMSSQCKKLIQAKQCFVESNSNGIQPEDACADLGRVASVPDREPRPVNEYDTEDFVHGSTQHREKSEVTVAVQLSIDRLKNLERLGISWTGHVSASIYIPHPRHSSATQKHLDTIADFHAAVEKHRRYSLDVGIVFALNGTEEVAATLEKDDHGIPLLEQYYYMYPVNVGRNVALGQVKTDFTLILDVDFVFSKDAYSAAHGGNSHWSNVMMAIRERAKVNMGTFAIIPAFQLGKGHAIPDTIAALLEDYREGYVSRMSGHVVTHCATDFSRWMNSEEEYIVQWGPYFEPYGIAATRLIPWFPTDFKGYHLNKILEYFAMAVTGWEFVVLPKSFVIHIWHPPAKHRATVLFSPELMMHSKKMMQAYAGELGTKSYTCDAMFMNSVVRLPDKPFNAPPIIQRPLSPDDIHIFDEVPCTDFLES